MSDVGSIGIVGLGTMGWNLALNLLDQGHSVHGWEFQDALRDRRRREESGIAVHEDLWEMVEALPRPRVLMLMVTAGKPVDDVLSSLLARLDKDDIVIDGGNSDYLDTDRRLTRCAKHGLRYLGAGVSGGAEGARHGPAIMVGGVESAWTAAQPLLQSIAAKTDGGEVCCGYLGARGAGHLVKMVHNGIEYADMQLIAEVYDILDRGHGLSTDAIADQFEQWATGKLSSFLIDTTVNVLRTIDNETGRSLVQMVLDSAGQKGTGRLTVETAMNVGVPVPTIAEAVSARALSAHVTERVKLSGMYAEGPPRVPIQAEILEDALYAAKLLAYCQGLSVIAAVARAQNWQIDLPTVAGLWRAGCIIRADVLTEIQEALKTTPSGLMLLSPRFQDDLMNSLPKLRSVVSASVTAGLPVPALSSALAYFDSFISARLPANLIQGLRDAFGAHGYERVDRPGPATSVWGNPA